MNNKSVGKGKTSAAQPDKVNEPVANVPSWLLDEEEDDAMNAQATADFLFEGTGLCDASNNGSSMESMSEYREHHSPAGGRPKKRAKMSNDGDDNENDMIDEVTKDTRFDKMYDFQAEDLKMSRILGGETIKTTKREKERLHQMETDVVDFSKIGVEDGAPDDGAQQRYRNLMNYEDEDDGEGGQDDLAHDAELSVHLNCRLCKHTSIRASEMDPGFLDAYMCITELDREKIMYATDAQIFKEMRIMFNAQQMYIKENGGTYFLVRTEEIKNHFLYHDTSNPLRGLNNLYREMKEIRRGARKHLFGKINERNMWNSQKTKVYLQLVKHEQALINNITMMRHHMNTQDTARMKGSAPAAKNSTSGKTRHLTSAQNGGRYTSKYIN